MRQSEITKATVLKAASKLFNTKGYKSTSLSDITDATGFTKGAIYRHFNNKETLEIAAFEKMMMGVFKFVQVKIKAENNAKAKLFCVLDLFESYINNPMLVGGCPLLNVAIETDDTNFELKTKAQNALEILRNSVETIVNNGKNHQQIAENINEKEVATIIIAALEGGIMMSKLQNSNSDINIIAAFLKNYIDTKLVK